jgi:hypothetical protein
MKHLLLILLTIISLGFSGLAQNKYGPTNDSLYLGFYRDSIELLGTPNLMIVPFHPDRYMSDVDRYIAEGTNYTYQHTRGFFRKGLDNCILIASKQYKTFSSMHEDKPEVNKDLDFVYKMSQTYVTPYQPPIISTERGFKNRLAAYWVKLQTEVKHAPEPGTRIKEGQLYSVEDNRELITKAKIYNQILVDSTFKKYKADYVVFITELNLINAAATQQDLELENYTRLIKVHFTVFDKEGNELFSLIKKEPFSSHENDLPTIIKTHFVSLGSEIIYALDSYRFLQAGLTPLSEAEVEVAKNKSQFKLPTLQKFR